MIGYVYRIVARGSNSVYVGQSVDPVKRFRQHRVRPSNPALANFLKKHPDAEIYFWPVLDMVAEEIADEAECRSLGFRLLNCAPCGGRPPSRIGVAPANKGKPISAEIREMLRRVNTGRAPANKGKKASPDVRAKISAAQIGKKRGSPSPKHRAAISAAKSGKKASPSARVNQSRAHIGKPWSPARRAAYEMKWGG